MVKQRGRRSSRTCSIPAESTETAATPVLLYTVAQPVLLLSVVAGVEACTANYMRRGAKLDV